MPRELSLTAASSAPDRIQLTWTSQAPLNSQVLIQRRMIDQTLATTLAPQKAGGPVPPAGGSTGGGCFLTVVID